MPAGSRLAAAMPAGGWPVALALGSNRCHGVHGRPTAVVRAAAAVLAAAGVREARLSPVIATLPIGPSDRRFANAVLVGRWRGDAAGLLRLAKAVERDFGRRRGRRWGARVLDVDVVAVGERCWLAPGLAVPHPAMATRHFVLRPLLALWPGWRHPRSGLTVRQMAARRAKARPVDCGGRPA